MLNDEVLIVMPLSYQISREVRILRALLTWPGWLLTCFFSYDMLMNKILIMCPLVFIWVPINPQKADSLDFPFQIYVCGLCYSSFNSILRKCAMIPPRQSLFSFLS